jgi:hypothetical protein
VSYVIEVATSKTSKKASKLGALFVARCLRTVNDLSKLILPLPLPFSCLLINLLQHKDLLFFNYYLFKQHVCRYRK